MQICLQLWADQRKGIYKGSVGIAALPQAQATDLSATDFDLVVPSGFALLCQRRGAGKCFREGGDSRSGTDRGFPLGREDECGVRGKQRGGTGWEGKKEPVGSTGWSGMVSHPLSFELLGFVRKSDVIAR